MSLLKTHAGTILAGVFGSIATVLVTYLLSASPDGPQPKVSVSWISSPTTRIAGDNDLDRQAKLLENLFGVPDVPYISTFLRVHGDVTLFAITISNDTNKRTKDVEIFGEAICCAIVVTGRGADKKFKYFPNKTPITIPPMGPEESARVFMLGTAYSYYSSFPLRILHAGARLNPYINTFHDRTVLIGTVPFLIKYAEFVDFAVILLLGLLLIFIAAVIHAIAVQNNFPRLIKSTSDAEASRIVRFSDFIREKYAQKLEPTLREPPRPSPAPPSPPTTQ